MITNLTFGTGVAPNWPDCLDGATKHLDKLSLENQIKVAEYNSQMAYYIILRGFNALNKSEGAPAYADCVRDAFKGAKTIDGH